MQEAQFDHYQCTTTTCFGEAGPSQYQSAEETRVSMESYLGMEGLFLTDTLVTDTLDKEYVPSGRPYIP